MNRKTKNAWLDLLKEFYAQRKEHILFILSLLIAAVISAFLLNFFLELVDDLKENELESLDKNISAWVFQYRSETLTSVFRVITFFGDRIAYLILGPLVGALLYFRGQRWHFIIQGVIVLLSAALINRLLKNVIGRSRPVEDLHLVHAHSYSFPSGHSMSALVFFGFLIYLTYRLVTKFWLKATLIVSQIALILAIGLSRIYLGVHYPSDVLAGFAAGLFWLLVCIGLFRAINFYFHGNSPLEKQ